MKFDITKRINPDLLEEQLKSAFGVRVVLTAGPAVSLVAATEDEMEQVRLIVEKHNPDHMSYAQRVNREWQSHVDAAVTVLGLEPGVTSYEDFVELLANDSQRVSELLWLLWLKANPPEV